MEHNVNDPNLKYGLNNSSDVSPETANELLFFFNYHEFLLNGYSPCGNGEVAKETEIPTETTGNHLQIQDSAIVVNHFPNPYASRDSEEYKTTRIVRIPRQFDAGPNADFVPQFSTFTPGNEPAAIKSEDMPKFSVAGEFQGELFGKTSATPLVPKWVGHAELNEIVTTINAMLKSALSPNQVETWLDNVLDFFSATLYSRVFTNNVRNTFYKRKIAEVEKYVENVNEMLGKRNGKLKMISPVESAFLSLDFQIPKPERVSESEKGPESREESGEK